jgi:ABC-type multidrug transport system fused ATPase/permease subunit
MRENGKKLNQAERLNLKRFWWRLWKLLTPIHKTIRNMVFLIVSIELSRLIGPYILKIIIDTVTRFQVEDLGFLIILIIAMFLSNQLVSIIAYFEDRKVFKILGDTEANLSNETHYKMVYLGLTYHEKENTGNKIIKIQRGVYKINDLLGNFFWEVAPTIFQVIFTTIILFILDWRFGIILLIFVPFFAILTAKANKEAYPFRKEMYHGQEEASGLLTQSVININTVKSFVQEEKEHKRFRKITQKVKDFFLFGYARILKYNLKRNLIIDSGRALILFFGIYLIWKDSITVGTVVFVFTISEKALISLYRISRLYDRIMDSSEVVERLYELSQAESEIKNPKNGLKPKSVEGQINFENVSFEYKESGIKALDGINLQINSGCITALVGPSGGGKTTLARMIYRHYDPTSGATLLDEKNLKDYDLYSFRKFIAIVQQEVEIFDSTIRENIAYAKPEASFKEIQSAAKIANAEEFITELKNGYETLVGERGLKLSGGQRQRIGIARAILANPKILIFDEATSNLDSYSEKLIQEAMEKISKGRTVIIIAHRLSTIKKANKIVVLEKGKIVEEGSHFELVKTDGGLYQKLINLQKMGDIE